MKSNDKIDRNQFMMTSLDEMIDENSNVRVIDAYVQSLDVEKLGYQVGTDGDVHFSLTFLSLLKVKKLQFEARPQLQCYPHHGAVRL